MVTPNGRGLLNARVILTDTDGRLRSATTNAFGYFNFRDVAAGSVYVVEVISKRYRYTPQIVSPVEDLTDLTFVAE